MDAAEGSVRPTSGQRPESGRVRGESPMHRRLLDALPLRGSRREGEAARLAGVSDRDARIGFAEMQVLGLVAKDRSLGGEVERRWRIPQRT